MTIKKIFLWLIISIIPFQVYSKIPFSTYDEIVSVHKLIDYHYSSLTVPRLFITKMPEDIKTIHGGKRVRFFIKTILPLILFENEKIVKERNLVLPIAAKSVWSGKDLELIRETARKYRIIKKNANISAMTGEEKEQLRYFLDHLIRPVPVPIALGMAALESGWGSSRFAVEANNLFGHTTQDISSGLKPSNWNGKQRHIKKFATLSDSIGAYLLNLNRNKAYMKFRDLRRENPSNYIKLCEGFSKYSRIEHEYIDRLKTIIGKFHLDIYFDAKLGTSEMTRFVEKIDQIYIN